MLIRSECEIAFYIGAVWLESPPTNRRVLVVLDLFLVNYRTAGQKYHQPLRESH